MKIITWNINGIRSGWKSFLDLIEAEKPEIIALQEIKVDESRLPESYREFGGYKSYWNHAEKPGYSGVAFYSKIPPLKVMSGFGRGFDKFDREGRVIGLDFGNFTLVNFYFPHTGRKLERLDFKLGFNAAVDEYVDTLVDKNVILCGDFNVAREEIDLSRPKDNMKNAGFTPGERAWADDLLDKGWTDAFRYLHPESKEYTWWSQRFGARERNIGWRIDYFLLSKKMKPRLKECKIEKEVLGSDHAPVVLEIEIDNAK